MLLTLHDVEGAAKTTNRLSDSASASLSCGATIAWQVIGKIALKIASRKCSGDIPKQLANVLHMTVVLLNITDQLKRLSNRLALKPESCTGGDPLGQHLQIPICTITVPQTPRPQPP
jgi:hypothetical protein